MVHGQTDSQRVIDRQVEMVLPLERITNKQDISKKIKLSRPDRQFLASLLDASFKIVQSSLADIEYRTLFRKCQLRDTILKEIGTFLSGSSMTKPPFSLGYFQPDLDAGILSLSPSRMSAAYCQKDGSVAELDDFLGERWDIQQKEPVWKYVSKLVMRLTWDFQVVVKVFPSLYRNILQVDNYRSILKNETSIPSPLHGSQLEAGAPEDFLDTDL